MNMEENEILTPEEVTEESVIDESVEMPEVADPTESEEGTEEEAKAEPEVQNEEIDRNAIFAEARRVAEANARKAQKAIDDEYVRRFGNLKNPITGQPIRSQADYLAALDAQEEMKARAQLEQNGVDPSLIDKAIANSPLMRQAQSIMAQQKESQALSQVINDIAEVKMLDPSINSLNDVPPDVIRCVLDNAQYGRHISLAEAYKLTQFGRVSNDEKAAIKQNAINQAKGKQHLSPVNGVSTPDEGVEIPESALAMWKEAFPEKSKAELKKLYNRSLQ